MKKIIIALVLFASMNSASVFANSGIRVVYSDSSPPFSWQDSDKEMKGILVDTANEIIERQMGIPVIAEGLPWKRAQYMVEIGEADAFVTIPTSSRMKYTVISAEPVIIGTVSMFTKKGHPEIEKLRNVRNISELKKFTMVDYLGNGWGDENLSGFKRKIVSEMDGVFLKLVDGSADVFLASPAFSHFVLKKLNLKDQVIEIPKSFALRPFHLCIGKKSPYVNILSDFDKIIRKNREDGKLDEIRQTYR